MCFEISGTARAKIAEKNIECWKYLIHSGKKLLSGVHGYRYKGTKPQPRVIIRKSRMWSNEYIVAKGYHSFTNEQNALISGYAGVIHKFIIPAGTRYFENETEYVSETIILVS